ncbi:MAG: hypothetical protein DRQ88_05945 [Epsilonproteobacteria bacterium]|nr:MAG: hypothetical protein DRQ88_05945 [Campylobacterota bacterium]
MNKINFQRLEVTNFGPYKNQVLEFKSGVWLVLGENRDAVDASSNGSGKCLGRGVSVLLYDGTTKEVQDLFVGDELMGPDSKPRKIIATTTGTEEMFRVIPTKGESFTCNGPHILNLKDCRTKKIVNISVEDHQKLPEWRKTQLLLHRSTAITFKKDPKIKLNPYFLGLWLGDGTQNDTQITNPDPEIKEFLEVFALKEGYSLSTLYEDRCPAYRLVGKKGKPNPLRNYLRDIGKRIPQNYKTGSIKDRLSLLAGLLDSDGYYSTTGIYEIVNKDLAMAQDILFVTRSLGLSAYISEKQVQLKEWSSPRTYYRITISGNLDLIPCKVKRKQAGPRKINKNNLHVGFKIRSIGPDEYFGFTLAANPLFLLADFTVTHNSFLFEGLGWALYGRTLRDDIARDFKHPVTVKVDFTVVTNTSTDYYSVTRYWAHENNKLTLICNNEDVSNRGKKVTQVTLEKVLGLSYQAFTSILFIRQGMVSFFSSLTGVARKLVIEEVAIDSWDDLIKTMKKDLKRINADGVEVQTQVNEIKTSVTFYEARIVATKEERERYNSKAVAELEEKRMAAVTQIQTLETEKQTYDLDKVPQVPEIRNQLASAVASWKNLSVILSEKYCPTCARPYPEDQMSQVEKDVQELVTQGNKFRETLNKAEAEAEEVKVIQTKLDLLHQQLNQTNHKPKEIEIDPTEALENLLGVHKESLSRATSTLNDLIFEVENLQFVLKALQPKSEFRTFVIRKTITILNTLLENIASSVFAGAKVLLQVEGDGIEIKFWRDGKELPLNNLSGGEKRKVDLAILLAFQRYLLLHSPFSLNCVTLDEVFDFLDEMGVSNFVKLIPSLFPEESSIFIITHNEDLKNYLPDQIKIVKENGEARIT